MEEPPANESDKKEPSVEPKTAESESSTLNPFSLLRLDSAQSGGNAGSGSNLAASVSPVDDAKK